MRTYAFLTRLGRGGGGGGGEVKMAGYCQVILMRFFSFRGQ